MSSRLVVIALALLVGADAPPGPRVRSSHPYIRAMIAEAQVRSATFRRLVDAVEATDGIVYVEEGECYHHVRSCVPPVVTSTADVRVLHVLVDARKEDWEVMSNIGHELQHVLEVLHEPSVRTDDAAFFHMHQSGVFTRDVVETEAAVKAGNDVKAEVRAFARNATTKGLARS
jgi:hypothetical protein